MIKKGEWYCENCGSTEVETKDWVKLNTKEATLSYIGVDVKDYWCPDCEDHHYAKLATVDIHFINSKLKITHSIADKLLKFIRDWHGDHQNYTDECEVHKALQVYDKGECEIEEVFDAFDDVDGDWDAFYNRIGAMDE